MLDRRIRRTFALPSLMLSLALMLSTVADKGAHAADLCTEITALVGQAQSNFEGTDAKPVSPDPLSGAGSCSLSLSLSGAKAYHCAWEYPFRSDDARTAFADVNDRLQTCFGGEAVISRDQSVNHPDSYDQYRYSLQQVTVSASIKDKSALQQTIVFVGTHGPATPD